MNIKHIISILMCGAAPLLLTNCDAHTDEHKHEEKEQAHEHGDEIHFSEQQAKAAGLQVETLTPGAFCHVIKVSGQIQLPMGEEQTVSATAAGIVAYANHSFTEGMAVSAGQAIATISAKKLQDADQVQALRVEYESARKEFERIEKLKADKLVTTKEYEQARTRLETAKVAYQSVAYSAGTEGVSVAAGKGGYIKSILVKEGGYVAVGDPIMTITQNRRLQLRAELPENEAKWLKRINSANFRVASDEKTYKLSSLNGKLVSWGKSSATDSYYVPVTFEFDHVDNILAGAFAEVYLLADARPDVLSVPLSAIVEEQGVCYVFVQVPGEPDAFLKKEVTTGEDNGERIEIISGVKAGDIVVTKGTYQVKLAATSSVIPEGHTH